MAKNNKFDVIGEIANMKETKLFKNAFRRHIKNNNIKINNKTEFSKVLEAFKNKSYEVR